MVGHRFTPTILGTLMVMLGTACFSNYRDTYNDAQNAIRNKQWAQADELLAGIPSTSDVYADALARRADVASAQGQYPKAVEFWQQAAKASPELYRKDKNRDYHRDFAKLLITSQMDVPGAAQSLFVSDDILVAHLSPNTLAGFDLKTKKQAWSHPIEKIQDADWSRRVFASGLIIGLDEVKTGDKPTRLVAFDAKTGAERWQQPLFSIASEMRISANDNYIFVSDRIRGGQQYEISTYDVKTGKLKWAKNIDGQSGPITAAKYSVFVWTSSGSIIGLKADTGEQLFSLNMAVKHNLDQLVADDRRVYLIGQDGKAYAFDASDKKYDPPTKRILWEAPIEANCGGPKAEAAVVDGKLIVPCWESVYSFDGETGKEQWKRSLEPSMGAGAKVAPNLMGGMIVIKYGAYLLSFVPANGQLRWMFDPGEKNKLTDASVAGFSDQILVGAKNNDKFVVYSLAATPSVAY